MKLNRFGGATGDDVEAATEEVVLLAGIPPPKNKAAVGFVDPIKPTVLLTPVDELVVLLLFLAISATSSPFGCRVP